MDPRQTLLVEIAAYCEAASIKETTFGRFAVNDGKFVGRLRGGKGVTLATLERAQAYIRANPPQPRRKSAA